MRKIPFQSKPMTGFTAAGVRKSNKNPNARVQVNDKLYITPKQHDDLVQHLYQRILATNGLRDPIIPRFAEIDKELSGHIVPTPEDRKRILDNRRGLGPKTVDENIQFALMQLDECVTFLMGIFAAPGGMYGAIASKDNQPIADGFSTLMNEHARVFQHYRHMAKSFLDALKYNIGGIVPEWHAETGPAITGSQGGQPKIDEDQLIRIGNRLTPIDPYNFGWDPAVYPVDVAEKGEFFFMLDMVRPFTLKRQAAFGEIFSFDRVEFKTNPSLNFFKARPTIQTQFQPAGATNWDQWFRLSYATTGSTYDADALERAVFFIWLQGSDFGLAPSAGDKPAIYRIEMINNEYIVRCDLLTNVHRMLPLGIFMPNEDGMMLQSRTFAEMLLPFQRFASSQLNIHQRAARKRLYGVTIYNRRVIPFLENEALSGGKIPANPVGEDQDLRKSFVQLTDAPDTSNTMADVQATLGLMQKLLPTTQANQVASLERATRYQAAAYVQASSKRNLKLAHIIDNQGLDRVRMIQMQNILQFQPVVNLIDQVSGKEVEVNPAQFRGIKMQFNIADGLRGLDTLLVTESLHDVINMLLQSQVARDYDIGGLINYWLNMQGDKMDFTQFRYTSPLDALDPQTKQLAFNLLQQAMQHQQRGQQPAMQGDAAQQPPPGGGMPQ